MSFDPWNTDPRAEARVKDRRPIPRTCPNCGSPVEIAHHDEIYGTSFGPWPWACRCTRIVQCNSYVGMHPGTNLPLGTLADAQLRRAGRQVKDAFNPLWQAGHLTRDEAYAALAKHLGIPKEQCHIGWFDMEQCATAVAACSRITSYKPDPVNRL